MTSATNATRQAARLKELDGLVNTYREEHGFNGFEKKESLGSHLFDWYREHAYNLSDRSFSDDDTIKLSDLPFNNSTFTIDRQDTSLSSRNSGTALYRSKQNPRPLAIAHVNKRRKLSSSHSPISSNVDTVFSPTRLSDNSMTSRADSCTSRDSVPPKKPPNVARHTKGHALPPLLSTHHPTIQAPSASPSDDFYETKSLNNAKSRPLEIADAPSTWEETHWADKMMMIAMRQDHNFFEISERWKQWTGNSDSAQHLQWRYKMLKKKLSVVTDADFRRLLKKDAGSRHRGDQAQSMAFLGGGCEKMVQYVDLDEVETDDDATQMTFEKRVSPIKPTSHGSQIKDACLSKKRKRKRQEELSQGTVPIAGPSEQMAASLWVHLRLPSRRKALYSLATTTPRDFLEARVRSYWKSRRSSKVF